MIASPNGAGKTTVMLEIMAKGPIKPQAKKKSTQKSRKK